MTISTLNKKREIAWNVCSSIVYLYGHNRQQQQKSYKGKNDNGQSQTTGSPSARTDTRSYCWMNRSILTLLQFFFLDAPFLLLPFLLSFLLPFLLSFLLLVNHFVFCISFLIPNMLNELKVAYSKQTIKKTRSVFKFPCPSWTEQLITAFVREVHQHHLNDMGLDPERNK